jgi:cyclic pyranopterin phosphate synthase
LNGLEDAYGRRVTSLRLSVTQRCNLNCFYCHKEGELSPSDEMTPEEIGRLVAIAGEMGMRKLKITGGEPLVREDIPEVIAACSPHIGEISLTTNGILLPEKAGELREAGLDRVNISLDTLDPEIYERISGVDALDRVLAGIDEALREDLGPIKLNMVLMNGLNHDQVEELIVFSGEKGTILQIIELETSRERLESGFYQQYHYDLGGLEEDLRSRAERIVSREMHHRMKYFLPTEVEVVRPMHNPEFCAHCNRLRVTSDGKLKPCLLSNDGLVDAISPMRDGADDDHIRELFHTTVRNRKPYWME